MPPVLRLPRGGPPAGTSSARSTRARTRTCTRTSTRSAATAARPGSRSSSCTRSPYLNLYLYPDEVDYARANALDSTWHNLQTSVRETDAPWELPPQGDGGPLIYSSLGSLGSGDVDLMRTWSARSPSAGADRLQGPAADQIRLHDNMWGEEFLPQPSILPQVDLVITHGGNNTTPRRSASASR